tara:strand:+ start:556 stop:1455 length:900 start_codon:yes stop_codon:yes gene_type:complete
MLFKRYEHNPIISPDPKKHYEARTTYNPTAIVHNSKIYLIYRAEGEIGKYVSRLCMAISEDGYNFKKYEKNPIIEPTTPEEVGGCEDPRITKIEDKFYLLYTSYNGKQPVTPSTINESLATSKNMVNWEKHGTIVPGLKSAALFSEKINGKYIMFIGGEKIRIARSDNLFDWEIDETGILDVREGKFDDRYVEVGPSPLVFDDKLALFFNTSNKKGVFHPSLALLDKSDPSKVLYRADKPIMTPTEEYEIKGYVPNVIFGEGLVEFSGTYFYYYGAADNHVGVATATKKEMEEYIASLV